MDRKDFVEITRQYYDIFQYFSQEEITVAQLEDGAKLIAIRAQNVRTESKINTEIASWDAADADGKRVIEENMVASDGRLIG